MSLKCAVQLSMPDIIHNNRQPLTLSQLISALPINLDKSHGINRLMSILTHFGFFTEQKISETDPEEAYAVTDACRLLVKDNPLTMAPCVLLSLDSIQMKPWHYLSSWFQNNDPTPYHTANGMAIWENAGHAPKLNNLFNEAMRSDSGIVASAMIENFKWVFQGFESLVDAGGNIGTLAKAIAEPLPHMQCTVLDLPHVVAGLHGINNLKYVAGNMFETIPQADAILLKSILHEWSDEECVKILRKCKEAISANGKRGNKVIIIDMVMENQKGEYEPTETQLCFNMLMMVLSIGRERNEKEWTKLSFSAGLSDYKINPILGLRSLIEIFL